MAEIEVSIICKQCGVESDVIVKKGNEIEVKPCEGCMLDSYNEGFDAAKNKEGS